MNDDTHTPRTRRTLTAAELDTIGRAVQDADSPVALFIAVIAAVYNFIIGGDGGRPLANFGPHDTIDPDRYQIPDSQRQAIVEAAVARAAAWGAGADIAVALADRMPATFHEPDAPATEASAGPHAGPV